MNLFEEIEASIAGGINVNLAGLRERFVSGSNFRLLAEFDKWALFASKASRNSDLLKDFVNKLEEHLQHHSYVINEELTLLDFICFHSIVKADDWCCRLQNNNDSRISGCPCTGRWFRQVYCSPEVSTALKNGVLSSGDVGNKAEVKGKGQKIEWSEDGKFVDLPYAERGKVCTRFPPEASGYLHIGHAKAALLNQHYKDAFEGRLIMRFDDTNPAKESEVFEHVILEDIKLLGLTPDVFTRTSDHFELLLEFCEKMIRKGAAFVDETDAEAMRALREQRLPSAARDRTVNENIKLWNAMKQGTEEGLKCCVRAKIDFESLNGCLRDPVIYRCKPEPHLRTGLKYKVYPTYDFACPIVDSIEGVTHALRTTEYHDRDPQYYWFIDVLELRRPHIYDYSRLALQNTVLSKRKLTWFVDNGLVSGWDDPRMPTVRGIIRRGMTIAGLKSFIIAQGSSKAINQMEWDKIWAVNKKVIDTISPRYTGIDRRNHVIAMVFQNGAPIKSYSSRVASHPKNTEVGEKNVFYSSNILLEKEDMKGISVGSIVTLINWGNMKVKVIKDDAKDGEVYIEMETDLENTDYKKTPKLTWLANRCDYDGSFIEVICEHYDHIITKAVLGKDEDFKQYVNYNSVTTHRLFGESGLRDLKEGDIIQLQRRGFYRVDRAWAKATTPMGTRPLVLILIPDGSTPKTGGGGSSSSKPSGKAKNPETEGKISKKQQKKAAAAAKK